jgi:site-specific DNA-methyltransferase (adenine-specific)
VSSDLAPPRAGSETAHASESVRVVQGDAIDVLAKVPTGTFDAVVTDPPHEILEVAWDVMPPIELWKHLLRVLKPGAVLIAIAAARTYHRLATAVEAAGFKIEDLAVWCFKSGRPPAPSRLKPAHAPILIARAPGPHAYLNLDDARIPYVDAADSEQTKRINTLRAAGKRRPDIYDDGINDNRADRSNFMPKAGRWPANVIVTEPCLGEHDRFFLVPRVRDTSGHPAAKPIALMAHLIRAFVPVDGTIVDPFAGGGTTGVAAAISGRRALLIERLPGYADKAARRVAAVEHVSVSSERPEEDTPAPILNRDADFDSNLTSNNEHLRSKSERARVKESTNFKTQKEIATELGISTRTVRRLMTDKAIPWIQVGRRAVRFDAREVRAALQRRGAANDVALLRQALVGDPAAADDAERREAPDLSARAGDGGRRRDARGEVVAAARRRGGGGAPGTAGRGEAPEGGGHTGPRHDEARELERLRAAADAARLFDRPVGGARAGLAERDDEAHHAQPHRVHPLPPRWRPPTR